MRKVLTIFALCLLFAAMRTSAQNTDPQCPKITVIGPSTLTRAGDSMTFIVEVGGFESKAKIEYQWSVSNGTMITGQDSPVLIVSTTLENAGENITATANVKGLPNTCLASASETAGVASRAGCGAPGDEYGNIMWPEEQARLDNMWIQVNNNPNATAFIYLRGGAKQTIEQLKKHAVRIVKHIRWREPRFDVGRLLFGIKKTEADRTTRLWLVPDGAELPNCDGCTIIDGKQLVP